MGKLRTNRLGSLFKTFLSVLIAVLGGLIFLVICYNLFLFVHYNFSFDYQKIDNCLDNGGKWDYRLQGCEQLYVDARVFRPDIIPILDLPQAKAYKKLIEAKGSISLVTTFKEQKKERYTFVKLSESMSGNEMSSRMYKWDVFNGALFQRLSEQNNYWIEFGDSGEIKKFIEGDSEYDCLNVSPPQLELNMCAKARYLLEKDMLFFIYESLTFKTSDWAKLMMTQDEWARSTDTYCQRTADRYEGGSIQPLVLYSCLSRATEERANSLEKILQAFK